MEPEGSLPCSQKPAIGPYLTTSIPFITRFNKTLLRAY
jgi:hypothetical protein